MIKPVLNVVFFRTDAGREPVREFLLDLTVEDRKAFGTDIKTVQFGWPLSMPLVRKMAPDLWEVRGDLNDGIARVLFTVSDARMVLLHAFVKKSPKTPPQEINTALARMRQLQESP